MTEQSLEMIEKGSGVSCMFWKSQRSSLLPLSPDKLACFTDLKNILAQRCGRQASVHMKSIVTHFHFDFQLGSVEFREFLTLF